MAELFGDPIVESDKNDPQAPADSVSDSSDSPSEKKSTNRRAKPKGNPNDARAEFVDTPPNDNHPDSLKG